MQRNKQRFGLYFWMRDKLEQNEEEVESVARSITILRISRDGTYD